MPKIQIAIPKDYLCPITQELMMNPVATSDGHTYEREAITKWLEEKNTSPFTNLPLENKKLTEIPFVKNALVSFREKNKLCTQKEFFDAVSKTSENRSTLYHIQKLNYLDYYLAARNDRGSTMLHLAVIYGHTDLIAWLLSEGADWKAKDNNGNTPLHLATCKGATELLLDNGSSVHVKNHKGQTPLHVAAMFGRAEVIKLLLHKNADLAAKDDKGFTPEDEASLSEKPMGDYDGTKYLLLVNAPDFEEKGHSKLHTAISYHQVDEVKFLRLLHENGCWLDLEAKDKHGFTPLCLAASRGLIDIVKWLLAEKVSIDAATTNIHGQIRSPIHSAVLWGHKEVVQLLLEHGANPDVLNEEGLTPVQVAERNGKVEIVKLFQLYEAPKKISELEKITQQQSHLIIQMQRQIKDLTLQIKQLTSKPQKDNEDSRKNYSPLFHVKK